MITALSVWMSICLSSHKQNPEIFKTAHIHLKRRELGSDAADEADAKSLVAFFAGCDSVFANSPSTRPDRDGLNHGRCV